MSVVQYDTKWPVLLEAMIQQQLLQAGEKTQEVFVPRTIRKIAISETLFPAQKSDVDVAYNYATKIVSTSGLQLIAMETAPLDIEKKSVRLDSVESTPLYNNNFNVSVIKTLISNLTTNIIF